jgi:hypothetical protein
MVGTQQNRNKGSMKNKTALPVRFSFLVLSVIPSEIHICAIAINVTMF